MTEKDFEMKRTSVNLPAFMMKDIDSMRGNIPRTVMIRELIYGAMCDPEIVESALRGGN